MLQNKGIVLYENHFNNSKNIGGGRYDDSYYDNVDRDLETNEKQITINWEKYEQKEVRKMENGLQEITTAITSAIAGIYCLVKVIINLIKKFKN